MRRVEWIGSEAWRRGRWVGGHQEVMTSSLTWSWRVLARRLSDGVLERPISGCAIGRCVFERRVFERRLFERRVSDHRVLDRRVRDRRVLDRRLLDPSAFDGRARRVRTVLRVLSASVSRFPGDDPDEAVERRGRGQRGRVFDGRVRDHESSARPWRESQRLVPGLVATSSTMTSSAVAAARARLSTGARSSESISAESRSITRRSISGDERR